MDNTITHNSESSPQFCLSIKQAIKVIGLGRTTLWKKVEDGSLKCFRIGRRVLFAPEHLREFLKLHEQVIRKPNKKRTTGGAK